MECICLAILCRRVVLLIEESHIVSRDHIVQPRGHVCDFHLVQVIVLTNLFDTGTLVDLFGWSTNGLFLFSS